MSLLRHYPFTDATQIFVVLIDRVKLSQALAVASTPSL